MSNDANNAVRFARKEDAQRVLDAMLAARPSPILARAPELYSVTEHMWHAAAQPQQDDPENDPPAHEVTDWTPPPGYDGDGSVAAMAARSAAQPQQAEQADEPRALVIRPGRYLTRDGKEVYIACRCSFDAYGARTEYPWRVSGKGGWSVDDAGRHMKNGPSCFGIVARVDDAAQPPQITKEKV